MIVLVVLITFTVLLVYTKTKIYEKQCKGRGMALWKKSKRMGIFWHYLTGQRAMFQIFDDMYKEYSDTPAVAFGTFLTPSIFLINPVNVHHVTTDDFHSFCHRGELTVKNDKLANNITLLHGPKWKVLRHAFSPLFTPAKLKNMYYALDKCARDFIELLKNNPDKLKGDVYPTMKTWCCAALTAAVFGMSTESPFESPFIKLTREAVAPTFWANFKFMILGSFPRLFKILNLSVISVQQDIFIRTIKQMIKERKQNECKNHDFVDLCVELQSGGLLIDPDTGFKLEPTDEVMAAQALILFLAGVEPCATGLFTTLFELGRNTNIQKRLQKDIDDTFEKYDSKLTYDIIEEIKYLDQVIKEALRMYPPIGFLTRECVKDAKLPVGNIKIEKNTKIYIPVYSQHHDHNYFPDPMVFNPERFSHRNNISKAYIPFGQGNRNCTGLKYAYIQIKTVVVYVLRHFDIESFTRQDNVDYMKEPLFVILKDVDLAMVPRKTAT